MLAVLFFATRDDRALTEGFLSITPPGPVLAPAAGRDREREREVLRTAPELGCMPTAPGEKGEEGTTTFISDVEPGLLVDGDVVRMVFNRGRTGGGPNEAR